MWFAHARGYGISCGWWVAFRVVASFGSQVPLEEETPLIHGVHTIDYRAGGRDGMVFRVAIPQWPYACVCVYVCMCICIYIHIYIYIHTQTHTHMDRIPKEHPQHPPTNVTTEPQNSPTTNCIPYLKNCATVLMVVGSKVEEKTRA